MAKITNIIHCVYGKKEGILCEHCGTYIYNVNFIEFDDGFVLKCGNDCFKNLITQHSTLSTYGIKAFNKLVKLAQYWNKELALWQGLTEKEAEQKNKLFVLRNYESWKDETFEKFKQWQIETFIPARLEEIQKELKTKFSKVKFKVQNWQGTAE